MGNVSCAPTGKSSADEVSRSRQIDHLLRAERQLLEREIKLLLLGAGESGKSTIFKQMKVIFMTGFNEEERSLYKDIIHSNIIVAMNTFITSLKCDESTELLSQLPEEKKKYVELISSKSILFDNELTNDIAQAVKALWDEPLLKEKYFSSSSYQINDSAAYYFDALDRISTPNYVPTEQDVLRSRARTTGITELQFSIKEFRFKMIDVGGQRSERKKWIHCFQDVDALIFCTAMSEYDLKLYEDETVNRMSESLTLFQEVINCAWFQDTAIILFMNKVDIFNKKIERVDLKNCFPEYTGGCDAKRGAAFLKEKFLGLNRNPSKSIYCHITCATNTENVTNVFSAVRDTILRQGLET